MSVSLSPSLHGRKKNQATHPCATRTSVQNSLTFSRIMLQCRSKALTRPSSFLLLRQLMSTCAGRQCVDAYRSATSDCRASWATPAGHRRPPANWSSRSWSAPRGVRCGTTPPPAAQVRRQRGSSCARVPSTLLRRQGDGTQNKGKSRVDCALRVCMPDTWRMSACKVQWNVFKHHETQGGPWCRADLLAQGIGQSACAGEGASLTASPSMAEPHPGAIRVDPRFLGPPSAFQYEYRRHNGLSSIQVIFAGWPALE